ncbi:MAG: glycosyltransferase [Lentisphaerae bacterium]|nr:glycosyltransferase [Lentisphaerota bacterium]MCP4101512.1 glycosyltransferase [Lentisphaerota bacterium]
MSKKNLEKYKVNFVSVVVPVFNEEGCLQELIDRSVKALDSTGKRFELILVDDGSEDATAEIMTKASEKNPDKVVSCFLNRNFGQHNAILAGFSIVRGDLVLTIDADLQNPPEEIPNLVAKAEEGYDVIGTVRQNRQDSFLRKLPSKIVNKMTQLATGVNMTDYGCMLRAYRRHIVEAMLQCNERSTFIPVLGNSFARYTCEIPVGHNERSIGDSKYSLWKLINLQFNLLTCMTTFPLRLLSFIGSGLSLLGILLGIIIIILRICMGDQWAAEGVFTLFAILFIISGFQLVGMGLLGEYIGRIYYDVRARPRFFIEDILGRKDEKKEEKAEK